MPWSGERRPLVFRSTSSARACSTAFGFSVITACSDGPLRIEGGDARQAHLGQRFGSQRARVERGVDVGDGRRVEVDRLRQRGLEREQDDGSQPGAQTANVHHGSSRRSAKAFALRAEVTQQTPQRSRYRAEVARKGLSVRAIRAEVARAKAQRSRWSAKASAERPARRLCCFAPLVSGERVISWGSGRDRPRAPGCGAGPRLRPSAA